ncbi:MAG: TonB-dependent receptor [Bacteroidota bacterium]|nr:TonB-dependent receptor [Bacteroidota bacterium]
MITVLDSKGKPLNQAVVFITTLEKDRNQVIITTPEGTAKYEPVLGKIQLFISHLSFENHLDTINSLSGDIQINLVAKNVKLEEVVVTSEYAPRTPGESVHAVAVINRQQIDNQAAPDLQSLLSQQLTMRVSQDPALGSGLIMNGLSGQNIKILVDGVPVIGRLDGNIDLGQMILTNVERIEVVNGPMAAAYGTDAAGGVINIITKQAIDRQYQAGINLLYESVGQYNADIFAGYAHGKSAFLINGGRNYFDGWSEADTGRWQEWKPKEQYFGNIKYRFTHKNLILGYQLSAFHEKLSNKGVPRLSPYFAYAFDQFYTTIRLTNQLNGSYILNRDWSVSGTVSHSYYHRTKNTYRKDLVSLNETLLPGVEDQDTTIMNSWMSRMVFSRAKSNTRINCQAGIDLSVDNADGSRFKNDVKQSGDYAAFASAEYKITGNLQVKPAIRVSYNTDYNSPVVPSIMFKYDFPKNLQARISYGKGYRAPGIKERYLYFVDINHNIQGNENLQPEYSDNYFVALNKKSVTGKIAHNTQLSGFYNDIRNLITLAQPNPDASLFTYINIGNFSTHGGSLTHSISWKNLSVNGGAGMTGRYNVYADSGDFKQYIYSYDFNAGVQYLFTKLNLTTAMFFKYNGKLPGYKLNDDNTITQFSNDSYRFLDVTIRKGFFNNILYVGTGVKNILNITHVNAFSQGAAHSASGNEQAVGTGRTLFVRLQYTPGK